jgi:hypothetical protein
MFVDIPIIGSVVNNSQLFSSVVRQNEKSMDYPVPFYVYKPQKSVVIQGYHFPLRKIAIKPEIIIKNPLDRPIIINKVLRVIDLNDDNNHSLNIMPASRAMNVI